MENMHEISITVKKPVNRQKFNERQFFGLTKRTTFFKHINNRCVIVFTENTTAEFYNGITIEKT